MFTISTIYKAVDKFSPIVRKMEQVNNNFVRRQNSMFKKLGSTFGNLRNQLIGLAGGFGIATILAVGAGAVVKYDSALQSLSAITGVTGKQFDAFKKKSMEVAEDVKQSSVDVLKAFELVGSAKPELLKSADALGEVSKQALILSKAGKLMPEDAVNALTVSLNQFGAGADKAAEYVDILATAQQKGSGTIQYLSEAIVNAGGTMRAFNNSFEDTIAILEGYAKAGVPAGEAGTMLAGIMSKLSKAQKKEFNPQFTKATDIINNLAKANLSYTELMKLTDVRGAKWLVQIINQNKTVQELAGNLNEVGNAQAQMATQTASFSEKIKQLRARYENLMISGNENSKSLEKFGKVIDWVTKNLDKIIVVIGYVTASLITYYTIMSTARLVTLAFSLATGIFYATQKAVPASLAKNVIALKSYIIAQKLAAAATWLFSAALWANPITWIVIGIAALIVGLILLIKYWDKVKAKIDEWSNSAVFQILSIIFPILKVLELIAFMQDRWDAIKKAFQDGGFLKGLQAIGKALLSFLLKPIEVIMKAVSRITGAKWASNLLENISEFRSGLDKDMVKEKPVNTEKVKTERYEEIVRQKLEIELNNKSDKKANLNYSPAYAPIVSGTYG